MVTEDQLAETLRVDNEQEAENTQGNTGSKYRDCEDKCFVVGGGLCTFCDRKQGNQAEWDEAKRKLLD